VQPRENPARKKAGSCFNPHRPFGAGATGPGARPPSGVWSFNPHRSFGAGATAALEGRSPRERRVSILTGPLGPVQRVEGQPAVQDDVVVSILTGPLGPVKPDQARGRRAACGVSIPTGLLGSVQPGRTARRRCAPARSFNPHRPFGAGATLPGWTSPTTSSFNPHRPFGAGATSRELLSSRFRLGCQD
jgi:hypothetical protein